MAILYNTDLYKFQSLKYFPEETKSNCPAMNVWSSKSSSSKSFYLSMYLSHCCLVMPIIIIRYITPEGGICFMNYFTETFELYSETVVNSSIFYSNSLNHFKTIMYDFFFCLKLDYPDFKQIRDIENIRTSMFFWYVEFSHLQYEFQIEITGYNFFFFSPLALTPQEASLLTPWYLIFPWLKRLSDEDQHFPQDRSVNSLLPKATHVP